MNPSINIDGSGNVVVNWVGGSFDEYHVGWRVNNGPRGARTRSGDKHFTVLMKYNPGSTYQVEVQGCVKHSLRHDECTTWDSISCGGAQSVCPGSPEAMRRPRRYTY